jgi:short-subunit dehydrogenase
MKIKSAKVLLTGANRGIGLALAHALAKRGAHLHVQSRSDSPSLAEDLKKSGATSVRVWNVDLAKRENIDQWLMKLQSEDIDILVNNAGQLTGGLLEEQPLDEIYSMFQVNLLALVQLTRGILPGMIARRRGKIVNNSSVSAVMHFPCASTYAASKSAVLAFTDCLQAELVGTGVSTLCLITPGIQTRMFKEIETKYSKNFEIPTDSISPEEYAEKICEAIEDDRVWLEPKGSTGVGLAVARYLPSLFRKGIESRFHR